MSDRLGSDYLKLLFATASSNLGNGGKADRPYIDRSVRRRVLVT